MSGRKSAVITGSTSGIGLGMARALAAAGYNIMLNGLGDDAEIEATRAELAASSGVTVGFHGANMLEPGQVADLIAQTETEFGCVDVLVNNAGIQHVAPIEEFPAEKWQAIIGINLSSAFYTIQAAVPKMKAAGRGRIINLASAHALVASPFKSAYVAAKHGIAGLTKTVALEVAEHGITCNAICPGYVLTPLVQQQIPDTARARGISEEEVKRDVLLAAQPTREFVTTEQIGALAVFLASDAAAAITGAIMPMDGGWTAQ
ncbi:MAG: 3-hydroxybutyrate dehydrogenase [Gammaproteobacteria bacterium]|nr:3-hydroxybutyrate dehydrogenase [Gammaproteobacteria bacterium]NNL99552.1 3-hydroxybutyrate dehydrogenase [Gammaproteobacteria bacterium]